jgi:hypothetical protein
MPRIVNELLYKFKICKEDSLLMHYESYSIERSVKLFEAKFRLTNGELGERIFRKISKD